MDRSIRIWLVSVMSLIAAIVIVGGITRLTGSGLSMVDWRPVMGILPPITQSQWVEVFSAYKNSPEYLKINQGMNLSQFKVIFFWEFLHRIMGRLIGLSALIPFIYFSLKGKLTKNFQKHWVLVIGLIICQGFMGWYMVKSGLVDIPHVSHFRLAAHLSLAFLIFVIILREYLKQEFPGKPIKTKNIGLIQTGFGLIAIQIVYGAFTAGLNAGHYYNSYPKMGPDWFPQSALMYSGGLINNMLNNPIMIQWIHRWFALAVVIGVVLIWQRSQKSSNLYIKYSGLLLFTAIGFQFLLGVITLLTNVWTPVAAAHQFGALILLISITLNHYFWTHELTYHDLTTD